MKKQFFLPRPVVLAIAASFIGALVVASCNKSGDGETRAGSEKKRTVGFAQVGAESAWRTAETESIKAEAGSRGNR